MPFNSQTVQYGTGGSGGKRLAQAAQLFRVVSISGEALGGAGANEVRFTYQITGLNGEDITAPVVFFAWTALTAHGAPADPAAGPLVAVITGTASDAGAFLTNGGAFGLTDVNGRLVIDVTDTTANSFNWLHVSSGTGPTVAARGTWGTGG